MKKLIISILVLLLICGGGTIYYLLKLKTYDISKDKELTEIAEEDYEIVLPPQDTFKDDKVTPSDSKESNLSSSIKGESSSSVAESPAKAQEKQAPQKLTAEMIIEKYRPSFESLESQANGKIESMISHAISEYKEKNANGEEISFSYFFSKYKSAGDELESKTNQAFEKLYSALQQDLKAHGFDPNEAQVVRDTYEAAKKQRRNALLSKAMDRL